MEMSENCLNACSYRKRVTLSSVTISEGLDGNGLDLLRQLRLDRCEAKPSPNKPRHAGSEHIQTTIGSMPKLRQESTESAGDYDPEFQISWDDMPLSKFDQIDREHEMSGAMECAGIGEWGIQK